MTFWQALGLSSLAALTGFLMGWRYHAKLKKEMEVLGVKQYRAKVVATAELTVLIKETANGDKEIVEVQEVGEIQEFEVKSKLD